MKKFAIIALLLLVSLTSAAFSQIPITVSIQILKAEDARRYDASLEKFFTDPNPATRKRAALAAGRIGDEKAIAPLAELLEKDPSNDVRAMAAFALGEIGRASCRERVSKQV